VDRFGERVIINLPVRSQVLDVDVESVAPVKGFSR
jgi:hypothetical protein